MIVTSSPLALSKSMNDGYIPPRSYIAASITRRIELLLERPAEAYHLVAALSLFAAAALLVDAKIVISIYSINIVLFICV